MLERILPVGTSFFATAGDLPDGAPLTAEESEVERALQRRRELASARACARRALAGLGVESAPVLAGPDGEPLWPDGVVGSVAHCDGFRGCAAARAEDFAAIGVDAEPNLPLRAGVLGDIALAPERGWVTGLNREIPEISWDRLLLCIKEAVYKTVFPLAGVRLGVSDAVVSVAPAAGTFSARLLVSRPALADVGINILRGRWLVADGIALAAIALRRGG